MPGTFILLAGPNAAGKTTIKNSLIKSEVKHYANPDKNQCQYNNLSPELIYKIKQRGMSPDKIAVDVLREWFENKIICEEGFATESNLATVKRDAERFLKAKKTGMTTKLYYVGLTLEKCLERQRKRSIKNEDNADNIIDDCIVSDRYYRGLSKISEHMKSGNVDVLKIYDNSNEIGKERLLLHIERGETIFRCPAQPEWLCI